MSEVVNIAKWLKESFFDIPVAYDRREEFAAAVKEWKASRKYHAKLYTLLKALRRRIQRKARNNTRRKPFYPNVRVPCDAREESRHTVMKDRLTTPFYQVLVDRELELILKVGIPAYLELEEKESFLEQFDEEERAAYEAEFEAD